MAYVKLNNNKGLRITHQQAVDILAVLEGRTEPADEKQAAFALKVKKVYFAWRSADPIWIMANISDIIPLALATWRVDTTGRPTRPDSDTSWQFAKRYQLWNNGGPSGIAKQQIDRYELKQRGYK